MSLIYGGTKLGTKLGGTMFCKARLFFNDYMDTSTVVKVPVDVSGCIPEISKLLFYKGKYFIQVLEDPLTYREETVGVCQQ
jgi:hypothetical protein